VDLLDPAHVPGVVLGEQELLVGVDDAGEGDNPVLGLRVDPGRAEEEVLVEQVHDLALQDLVKLVHLIFPPKRLL